MEPTIIEEGELPTSRAPGSVGLFFKLSDTPNRPWVEAFSATHVNYSGPAASTFLTSTIEDPTVDGDEIRWLVPIHLREYMRAFIDQRVAHANSETP